jgi:hypothetical protein
MGAGDSVGSGTAAVSTVTVKRLGGTASLPPAAGPLMRIHSAEERWLELSERPN